MLQLRSQSTRLGAWMSFDGEKIKWKIQFTPPELSQKSNFQSITTKPYRKDHPAIETRQV